MKKLLPPNEYLFVLGRASSLCQAELKTVLAREETEFKVIFSSPEILHLVSQSLLDPSYLISLLGGTIKISQVFEAVEDRDETTLVDKISNLIKDDLGVGEQKVVFGLSGYGNFNLQSLNYLSKEVKERLATAKLRVRFVLPWRGISLSSVVVKKQKVFEVVIVEEKEKFVLGKTLVVQDFEDWGKRDFGRPAPDPHQGMMPPKVARMMVNLVSKKNFTILDPFCGVGTILMEGLLLGYRVIGSDQSSQAIEKTKKNLNWLISQYPQILASSYQLFVSEASHISQKLPASSIDAVVSEPYLGPALTRQPTEAELRRVILGLEKLYLGALKEWFRVLRPGAMVSLALPSFRLGQRELLVKKPIDTCENLGYTLLTGPYQYSRPQAWVVRNIFVLRRKNGSH